LADPATALIIVGATSDISEGGKELCQREDRSVGQVTRDFDLTRRPCGSGSSRPSARPGQGMTAA
jgi:hypothetical protein